jgi:hypothetical protein
VHLFPTVTQGDQELTPDQAFVAALFAALAVAEPIPYPPSVTARPVEDASKPLPFFGHKAGGGNYQPTSHVEAVNATKPDSALTARVLKAVREVGEWVQNSAVARWDQNIQDGIGDGQDVYQYVSPPTTSILFPGFWKS